MQKLGFHMQKICLFGAYIKLPLCYLASLQICKWLLLFIFYGNHVTVNNADTCLLYDPAYILFKMSA